MEKELETPKREKMNSSSDFTISSDWDVIDNETSLVDLDGKKSEEASSEDLKEKENVQKGSCVDDIIPQQETNGTQEDSCVPDITEPENNNQHENSSSSEFDVLDESVEDNQSNLSFSHMEYSISSSLGESSHPSLVPEVEAEAEEVEADPEPQTSREYSLNVHPYLVAVTLSLAFIAILIASAPFGSIKQMKERMNALQTENDELKSMVQSKLENDKLLMALEEQIKSLKDENFKLSESMKALVAQLEEQTAILRKDKETKEQDPYRSEIEKLKEQINILQIDNEELQKQLVRTRYGIYSPHSKDTKANPSTEEKEDSKDKPDNKENRDNSSEILVEEINELRKKLYTEVEKLQGWKDSVQHLVKKLSNSHAGTPVENEKQNFESKESFDHTRSSSSSEWSKKPKPGKKGKKFSDWSWRDVKKNLKETFEGLQDIDVPNMFSNYVDKKKIEGVFESVGHYFKKAQEKTKKVLVFKNDVNEEIWNFFGQLKNQWNEISDRYQKHFTAKQAGAKTENHESQFSKRKLDTKDFEAQNKFDGYHKQKKPRMKPYDEKYDHTMYPDVDEYQKPEMYPSDEKYDHTMYPDVESFPTPPTMEIPDSQRNQMPPEEKEAHEDNSWVFKRAAHRSQLREEEQEAFTNWFLKRGRDFHYNEDESLKEWFKETYQNGHSDED